MVEHHRTLKVGPWEQQVHGEKEGRAKTKKEDREKTKKEKSLPAVSEHAVTLLAYSESTLARPTWRLAYIDVNL